MEPAIVRILKIHSLDEQQLLINPDAIANYDELIRNLETLTGELTITTSKARTKPYCATCETMDLNRDGAIPSGE
ncbi:MAG: hypothetical protein R3C26_22155 [Calditrichia bacterium]